MTAQHQPEQPLTLEDLKAIVTGLPLEEDSAPHPPDPEDDQAAGTRHLVLTPASKIRPRRVRWLWDGRLALGSLGLLAGPEGLGKSTLGYTIAADITRGTLPGEYYGTPHAVLVCASEDSWEYTIVPRLMAAGADLDLVFRVEMRTADDIAVGLSLPRDLVAVEQGAKEVDAAMMILDPLMSRIAENIDTHKDGDVRRALEPLVAVADRAGMAILGLIHHNKSGSSDPLQLVMASKAFTAVARSVHTVIKDPEDDTDARRLFGTPKNNLGRSDLPTLSFTIVGHQIDTDEGPASTGQLVWGEVVEGSIGDAMRRAAEQGDDRSATTEAADWLTDYLASKGGTDDSATIKREGARAGHSADALKRARRKIKAPSTSQGYPRRTWWSLPGTQSEQTVGATPRGDAPTAPTAPTGAQSEQSEQLEQSARTRKHAPTRRSSAEKDGDLGTCEVCHQPMTKKRPDQTRHFGCEPRAQEQP